MKRNPKIEAACCFSYTFWVAAFLALGLVCLSIPTHPLRQATWGGRRLGFRGLFFFLFGGSVCISEGGGREGREGADLYMCGCCLDFLRRDGKGRGMVCEGM